MFNPMTNELRNIDVDDVPKYIENGWKLGVNYKAVKNRIYITKDKINKRIYPEEATEYINEQEFESLNNDAIELLKMLRSSIITSKQNHS